jgi:hypothetical protein
VPSSSSSSGGSPSTSSAPSNALPVKQPCSLLSSSDLSQLDLDPSAPPSRDQVGTASSCDLSLADGGGGVIVGIRTNEGLSAMTNSGVATTSLTIGTHQAAKQTNDAYNTGSCLISLGVSSSSRVDVTANTGGSSDACPDAMKVAQLVEPHLP